MAEYISLTFTAGTGGVEKGQLVKLSSTQVVACDAITDKSIGVALDSAGAGDLVAVVVQGVCFALAGGTITKGAALAPDATGSAQIGVTTQFPIAIAKGGAASGGFCEVFVNVPAGYTVLA